MLDLHCKAAARKHPEAQLSKLRLVNSTAAALAVCVALACLPTLQAAFAQAQRVTVIKKKAAKKTILRPKEEKEPERASFSAEDETRAVVPGIADARSWGIRKRTLCACCRRRRVPGSRFQAAARMALMAAGSSRDGRNREAGRNLPWSPAQASVR